MAVVPEGLFVPAIPELRTLKGPGGCPALKAQIRQLRRNLMLLHRITQKKDGLCDVEILTDVANGDKWPSSVRKMTVKIKSFVKGAADLVKRTDAMLESYGNDNGCSHVAEINELIEFINDRLNTVNTCIQAGSNVGGWPGCKPTDNEPSFDDVKAMLEICQEEEDDRQELEEDAARANQARRGRREARLLAQLNEKHHPRTPTRPADAMEERLGTMDIVLWVVIVLSLLLNGVSYMMLSKSSQVSSSI